MIVKAEPDDQLCPVEILELREVVRVLRGKRVQEKPNEELERRVRECREHLRAAREKFPQHKRMLLKLEKHLLKEQ